MKRVWALDVLECPALPRTDANPHSDSFTGCDRKDSWLRRSAFPISSTLTCGARIQRCYRTILKPAVKMVQATSARFGPLLVKTLRPPGTRNSRLESSARPRLVYIMCTVTGISSLPLRPWNPEPALEFPTPPIFFPDQLRATIPFSCSVVDRRFMNHLCKLVLFRGRASI